ncbi:peptide ABC transporter substrate-binding protein [Roseburia hominis]
MRKRTRLLAGLVAAVLAVTTITGCGGAETRKNTGSGESSADAKVFNYSVNSVIVGLNPIMDSTAPDNEAHNLICEPLVRKAAAENNTMECIPAAAESWDVSEDGKTYTFHLREGMKWNDGEPFTAKDFEYTLKLMANPDTAAVNAWLFDGVIENFGEALYQNGKTPDEIGVSAPDDTTLEIRLTHPASYLLELLGSLFPVRQDKYEEWGQEYGSSADKIICSGPFEVESWSQNTEFVAKRNENNWNAANVKLDKIVQKVIQEPATAIQAFINGEIDVVSTLDPNWAKTIEEAGISTTETVPDSSPEFLMFNLANEYLSNVKIRQALSAAFDREEFIDATYNGQAIPIYSVMPDTMMVGEKTYTELVGGRNYFVKDLQSENPDPKKLMQEGLKELGKSDDLSQVTLRFASRGTTELSKKMAEWYKQTWEANLGITVQIDMMEWNVMWEKIDAGDYDIAVGGWGPYYNEPSAILTLFDPENGYFNAEKIGWKDENAAKFKELCNTAKDTVDDKEKAELYLQAEELLVKNAIVAPEYLSQSPTFIANTVEGYIVATNGYENWANVTVNK